VPAALLGPLLLATAGAIAAVVLGVWFARVHTRAQAAREQAVASHAATGRWLDDGALGGGRGLSPELMAEVRRIHIHTGQRVTEVMAGEYKSLFKGRGMEFEEVREYVPGDDVRTIDWNVTARMQRPFVKEFREERELVVMILVDISASGDFGTRGSTKNEVAARLAATLAFAAVRNNDKVGLILFSDRIERFVPPKKGRGHVWRVIKEILDCERRGSGTDLAEALSFLTKVVRRKAVVFLVSDFLSEADDLATPLRLVNRRHDLVVFQISDPRERALPDVGFLALEDAESGAATWIDTSSSAVRARYAQRAQARSADLATRLRRLRVDLVQISTDEGVVGPLTRYFRQRERSMR
jgi:uncharacterized protein (DUF58 family)